MDANALRTPQRLSEAKERGDSGDIDLSSRSSRHLTNHSGRRLCSHHGNVQMPLRARIKASLDVRWTLLVPGKLMSARLTTNHHILTSLHDLARRIHRRFLPRSALAPWHHSPDEELDRRGAAAMACTLFTVASLPASFPSLHYPRLCAWLALGHDMGLVC